MFRRPPAGQQAAVLINVAVVVVVAVSCRALEPTAFSNYQKTKSDS